jgi:single-stranded DNA-binding protein
VNLFLASISFSSLKPFASLKGKIMNSTSKNRSYPMLNKVMVIGRLIRDAEVRYLDSVNGANALQLTTFVLALDGTANYGQEPGFLEFSHLGDFAVAEHLLKGRLVYVEGHITQQRKEVEGQKRTYTNFQCDRLQLLSSRPQNEESVEQDEEELLPPVSPHALLQQALVTHYGPSDSWSGKQVATLVRWLKEKSGVNADSVTLEGLRGQIQRLSSDQAQRLVFDLNQAIAHKTA